MIPVLLQNTGIYQKAGRLVQEKVVKWQNGDSDLEIVSRAPFWWSKNTKCYSRTPLSF